MGRSRRPKLDPALKAAFDEAFMLGRLYELYSLQLAAVKRLEKAGFRIRDVKVTTVKGRRA